MHAHSLQAVRGKGIEGHELPPYSALTVPVPGAAALWEDVVKQHGSKPLAEARSCCYGTKLMDNACHVHVCFQIALH